MPSAEPGDPKRSETGPHPCPFLGVGRQTALGMTGAGSGARLSAGNSVTPLVLPAMMIVDVAEL